MVHPIFIQTFYYAIVMVLSITIAGMLLKGFFMKYVKVRLSFGKYILVKVRSALRDYYCVGWVEENYIVYKRKRNKTTNNIRILIPPGEKIFYRSLSVTWVDVEEELNAACSIDYTSVTGYDAEKYDDLLTRALMKPAIKSNFEKVVVAILVGTLILCGAAAYLSYLGYNNTQILMPTLNAIKDAVAANTQTIAASTGLG